MRRYETIFILDPDLPEDGRGAVIDRIREIVSQEGGFPVAVEEWGAQKLAYEIKRKPRGFYLRLDYCGGGAVVSELERASRIDDRVMKFMTVLLEEDVDEAAIKAEMARVEEEKAEAEKASAETAEESATPAGDATPEAGSQPETQNTEAKEE